MLLSLFLAWAAVLTAAIAAAKYLARISWKPAVNRAFSRTHTLFGHLLLLFGLLHGILAGNVPGGSVHLATQLFPLNWGTGCFVLSVVLCATFYLRKRLKKGWMKAHRVCTVVFLVCLVIHIVDVGIQMPGRLGSMLGGTPATETVEEVSPAVSEAIADFDGAELTDGTYTGEADGFNGTITVSVTVAGGEVADISVVSNSDTPGYFESAQSVLSDICENQTLDVDTVSGATFSSAGLINAVADALEDAVVSGELAQPEVSVPTQSGGHHSEGKGHHGMHH